MGARKGTAGPPGRVDRAVTGVRRAVGRLVKLLGDEDMAVVEKAARAPAEVGPFAVGPLAAALPRAASPGHQAAILGALVIFGPQDRAPVLRALAGAMRRDPDERLRAAAESAFTTQVMAEPMPTVSWTLAATWRPHRYGRPRTPEGWAVPGRGRLTDHPPRGSG